jgi:hypothetical protein
MSADDALMKEALTLMEEARITTIKIYKTTFYIKKILYLKFIGASKSEIDICINHLDDSEGELKQRLRQRNIV